MSSNSRMYYIDECSLCGTGPLGLRYCGKCKEIAILCEECEAIWITPDTKAPPLLSQNPTKTLCPKCKTGSLLSNTSHWATLREIQGTPWLVEALEHDQLQIHLGHAATKTVPAPEESATKHGGKKH